MRLLQLLKRTHRVATARESGQVLVIFAIFVIVMMVLAGSAFDYASIVVDDAKLQNAVDSALLAGANSLSRNATLPGSSPVVVAEATTRAYLAANSVATNTTTNVNITFPASTAVPGQPASLIKENIILQVTQRHATVFWPLIGINSVDMQGSGGAHAARAMTDIMLSLDTTASMYLSGLAAGRNDFQALRNAAEGFILQVNPSTSDTRGPKIGIARFAGIKCAWQRSGANADPTPDAYIDVRPTGTVRPQEYQTGCSDDMEVLIGLTNDRNKLLQVADAAGGVPCPTTSVGACPLQHVWYTAPQVSGTPIAIVGVEDSGGTTEDCYKPTTLDYNWPNYNTSAPCAPGYTGTKLPNGLNAMTNTGLGYTWSTTNGGRNDELAEGNSRKVLVLMTDGVNEAWPDEGPQQNKTQWDLDFAARATAIKLGADGVAGTPDDVEIYTVGFFCTPYASSSSWCKSQLAGTSAPHPCPGTSATNYASLTTSAVDDLLRDASSSTGNGCDHYFPLSKTESLPAIFQQLAGTISRGQLTN